MAKNPNRVAAGKKAYAKMKREGRGLAGGTKKKRGGSVVTGNTAKRGPKLPSLAKTVSIVGGVVVVTGLGADAVDGMIGEMDDMMDALGLGVTVTGIGIVAAVNVLKGLSSFFPWFGRKYRAWLRGYGLRP